VFSCNIQLQRSNIRVHKYIDEKGKECYLLSVIDMCVDLFFQHVNYGNTKHHFSPTVPSGMNVFS